MKYREADLDYIYIRVKLLDGGWGSYSLNEISDQQFIQWAEERFGTKIKDSGNMEGKPWTPKDKVDFLNHMNQKLGRPCVVMVKREARNEWNRGMKQKKSS